MFKKNLLLELLLVSIITIPAFISLFYGSYFTMHDDQHIVRLFLLDQGIKQGSLYPRWIDGLGFGFGYPLFNFYPPLIYYVAEFFHFVGFSFIVSIKLMIVTGFIGAAIGIYLFAKDVMGKAAGLVTSVLYTYFFYHAVTVFVRGAFAEFFTFSILPFVFLFLYRLNKEPSVKNSIGLGISFAALILTHPLIAFPSIIYIGVFFIFFYFLSHPERSEGSSPDLSSGRKKDAVARSLDKLGMTPEKWKFFSSTITGLLLGLSFSAFFWLPSMIERRFTMVDSILLKELASYKIHFIELSQLWYSPWGYGGSVAGTGDGFTFQLGKIHILFFALSFVLFFIYWIKTKKIDHYSKHYLFFSFLLAFSLFMTLPFSSFIWDNVHFLWYLQFPWRFLTFAAVFISLCGGFVVFFASHIDKKRLNKEWILLLTSLMISIVIIFKYQQYFKPQTYVITTDLQRTTDEEIKWHISRTSFEFVPNGVKTTKSNLNTTILDIKKKDIAKKPYQEDSLLDVKVIKNEFKTKWFDVKAKKATKFQLNTFYFPGWKAYINNNPVPIDDNNAYKLITIQIPKGESSLQFYFDNTPIRIFANATSIISLIYTILYFAKRKFDRLKTS